MRIPSSLLTTTAFVGAGIAAAQDATSKDALFGVTESSESAPSTSKDALFGVTDVKESAPVKFSGFFDALGAYTYRDPRHWSRGSRRKTRATRPRSARSRCSCSTTAR